MAIAIREGKTIICGSRAEVFKLIPRPKGMGPGFLAYREKGHRKATVLLSGLTKGGIELAVRAFRERGIDPTAILLNGEENLSSGKNMIKLTRISGKKFRVN